MIQYPAQSNAQLRDRSVAPLNPLDIVKTKLGIQRDRQVIQENDQTLQANQASAADDQAIIQAVQKHQGNPQAVQQELDQTNPRAASKWQQLTQQRMKGEADLQSTRLGNNDKLQTAVGNIAYRLKGLPPEQRPEAYRAALVELHQAGLIDQQKYAGMLLQEPDTDEELDNIIRMTPVQATVDADAKAKAAAAATAQANRYKVINPGDVLLDTTTNKPAYENPKAPEKQSFEELTYQDFLKDQKLTAKYGPGRAAFAQWQKDIGRAPTTGEDGAVSLTPASLEVVARRYLQDGTLPPMGNGAAGAAARSRILNRAAEIDPQAAIAANAASFKADQDSLKKTQGMADAVNAFESTAKKNLAQFIATAKKVKDSGSPWINKGLRSVQRAALGSEDQAAYDAARQVALTEIAKVVSNPNLTGVLSDSARQEMEALLRGDATLAQTLKVAEMLTQDMDNRKGSIDDQLKEIKGRIKGGGTAQPVTVQFNGQNYTFPNAEAANGFKQEMGIK